MVTNESALARCQAAGWAILAIGGEPGERTLMANGVGNGVSQRFYP